MVDAKTSLPLDQALPGFVHPCEMVPGKGRTENQCKHWGKAFWAGSCPHAKGLDHFPWGQMGPVTAGPSQCCAWGAETIAGFLISGLEKAQWEPGNLRCCFT